MILTLETVLENLQVLGFLAYLVILSVLDTPRPADTRAQVVIWLKYFPASEERLTIVINVEE